MLQLCVQGMTSFLELSLCIHIQGRGNRSQPDHEALVGILHLGLLTQDHILEGATATRRTLTKGDSLLGPIQDGPAAG